MQPAITSADSKPVDDDDGLNTKTKGKKLTAGGGGRLSNDGLAPLDADHLNRVHEELEKLNIATDVINKLELQLDEARAAFREIQASWTQRLDQMTKKLGTCIEKSRPYYEAKLEERRIRDEAQKAAIRFERANSMHAVAKQQVALTQESLNRQNTKTVDAACLEVLNHHVQRVNEAEEERLLSEEEHRRVSQRIIDIAQRIKQFEKEQGRTIKKSRVYFDARVEFTRVLEQQKALIQRLEAEVRQKKVDYTTSLRNLEKISEAIHEERQIAGLQRGQGVGCESPDPPPTEVARVESEAAPPLLTSVLPSSPEQLPYDTSAVNLRDRSISDPIDPSLFDGAGGKPPTETKRPVSLGSGVILLAQQLTGIGTSWIAEEEKRRAASKAFTFPPEDVDVRYRTAPEGVKPLPTPPLPDPSDSDSEVCSLASGRGEFTDEELTLRGMLRSHTDLINEIDICAERLKQSMHVRSVSDAERESASGESSAGF